MNESCITVVSIYSIGLVLIVLDYNESLLYLSLKRRLDFNNL